jgi:ribosomal-protein-alanine N-acetyltransferase
MEVLTERLLLRPVCLDDVDALLAASERPDRVRATRLVNESSKFWHAHGYGVWAVLPISASMVIGWCGVRPGSPPTDPELLYGLAPAWRRRGLATEMVRTVAAVLLGRPGVESVWAATTPDHQASIRVMEKAGMAFERRTLLDGVDSVIYRVSAVKTAVSPGGNG